MFYEKCVCAYIAASHTNGASDAPYDPASPCQPQLLGDEQHLVVQHDVGGDGRREGAIRHTVRGGRHGPRRLRVRPRDQARVLRLGPAAADAGAHMVGGVRACVSVCACGVCTKRVRGVCRALCDTEGVGKLSCGQFALAMWLVQRALRGVPPPPALTPDMVPPPAAVSIRILFLLLH